MNEVQRKKEIVREVIINSFLDRGDFESLKKFLEGEKPCESSGKEKATKKSERL